MTDGDDAATLERASEIIRTRWPNAPGHEVLAKMLITMATEIRELSDPIVAVAEATPAEPAAPAGL